MIDCAALLQREPSALPSRWVPVCQPGDALGHSCGPPFNLDACRVYTRARIHAGLTYDIYSVSAFQHALTCMCPVRDLCRYQLVLTGAQLMSQLQESHPYSVNMCGPAAAGDDDHDTINSAVQETRRRMFLEDQDAWRRSAQLGLRVGLHAHSAGCCLCV